MMSTYSLLYDAIDEQIIARLVDNARQSFRDIGDSIGLSAPAVKRRVDRLQHNGVITGFSARISPAALGRPTQAFVSVTYAGNVTPARIRALLEPIGHVVAAYTVSGDADVLVHLRAKDMADFEQALEQLRATGVVARTESTVVLSTLLDRTTMSSPTGPARGEDDPANG